MTDGESMRPKSFASANIARSQPEEHRLTAQSPLAELPRIQQGHSALFKVRVEE